MLDIKESQSGVPPLRSSLYMSAKICGGGGNISPAPSAPPALHVILLEETREAIIVFIMFFFTSAVKTVLHRLFIFFKIMSNFFDKMRVGYRLAIMSLVVIE